MSEGNSRHYAIGLAHGLEDDQLIKSCPSLPAIGPTPPWPGYRVMYDRGYWSAFTGRPHVCTRQCRREAERARAET